MPLQKIVSGQPLRQAQVRSLAPATADLAASLAGRVRYLYELATGVSAAPDGGATPLNPQGRLGIDHSGPPWGNAFQHPVWIAEGFVNTTTNVYGEGPLFSLTTSNKIQAIVARFVVRPFQYFPLAPYSQLYLTARGTRASGAGTATVAVRIYDGITTDGAVRSTTISSSGSIASVATEIHTLIGPQLPARNGWIAQERRIEFELTSTDPMNIHFCSINQVARRSH